MIERDALLCFVVQSDMLHALAVSKPTVGEKDLLKLKEFADEFGQEG